MHLIKNGSWGETFRPWFAYLGVDFQFVSNYVEGPQEVRLPLTEPHGHILVSVSSCGYQGQGAGWNRQTKTMGGVAGPDK